jgi:cyclopropane-fatty-acyl-phospholipid synthase
VIDLLLDRALLPDAMVRAGIRRVVAARLREQQALGGTDGERVEAVLSALSASPIALETAAANAQHYELPPVFFEHVLGPHLKYSSGYWPAGVESLAEAESRMLRLTAERARIEDGQRILELGCGWGSLTLDLARAFPRCRIVAMSNSGPQREYILAKARARGLDNVAVVTADINVFDTELQFDRIVSVEMLEHVRNHRRLFARIHRWLAPGGRFFTHVFTHRRFAYTYEDRGPSDWMARHFFTGGMMLSDDFFVRLQDRLALEDHWRVDGRHYQRTADAWLQNFDRNRRDIDLILAGVYGRANVARWRARGRAFFMGCAEMFGFRDGQEWGISHYRFQRRES